MVVIIIPPCVRVAYDKVACGSTGKQSQDMVIGPYAFITRLVEQCDVSSMRHRISPDPEPGNIHKKRTGKLPVFKPLRCLRTLS